MAPGRTPSAPDVGGALHFDAAGARVSDPTPLTTQQLLRENLWLRELIEARIKGIEGRMEASDEAVRLLQRFADRTPTTMDVGNAVERLREVVFEKFEGVKTQLIERDTMVEKASRDVKSAVDAAFVASKGVSDEQNKSNAASNAKTEASFTKQIDLLGETIKGNTKSTDDKFDDMKKSMDGKLDDIKQRITVIESKTSVSDPSSAIAIAELKASVHRLSSVTDISTGRGAGMAGLWGLIVGGVVAGAAVIASIVAIITRLMN